MNITRWRTYSTKPRSRPSGRGQSDYKWNGKKYAKTPDDSSYKGKGSNE